LLVGGGAIVGAVLLLRVLPWTVRSMIALRADAAERVELLSRADDVLAGAPAARDSLARALSDVVALAPKLVDGHTPGEAQAALSGFVSLTATRHALRVVRLDPLPDSALGAFGRVALHAELEGDVAGLTRFLRTIEVGAPLLTVPALSMQAADPVGRPNVAERLRIEATVAGLYLPLGAK
jgi:hypothetical protein